MGVVFFSREDRNALPKNHLKRRRRCFDGKLNRNSILLSNPARRLRSSIRVSGGRVGGRERERERERENERTNEWFIELGHLPVSNWEQSGK